MENHCTKPYSLAATRLQGLAINLKRPGTSIFDTLRDMIRRQDQDSNSDSGKFRDARVYVKSAQLALNELVAESSKKYEMPKILFCDMKEVLGTYHNGVVYLSNSLSEDKLMSVCAHEYYHYWQDLTDFYTKFEPKRNSSNGECPTYPFTNSILSESGAYFFESFYTLQQKIGTPAPHNLICTSIQEQMATIMSKYSSIPVDYAVIQTVTYVSSIFNSSSAERRGSKFLYGSAIKNPKYSQLVHDAMFGMSIALLVHVSANLDVVETIRLLNSGRDGVSKAIRSTSSEQQYAVIFGKA